MSLKQALKTPAWREQLDPFLKPLERWRPLPPCQVQRRVPSGRSGLISTAVDTAIRLELGRRRPDALEWPWMAEEALAAASPTQWTFKGIKPFAPIVRERFFAALGTVRLYRELIAPTVEEQRRLARASLELATLDGFGRLGVVFGDAMALLEPRIGKGDVDEVTACLDVCPWNLFDSKGLLLLGPDFGNYARRVNGADSDVIAGERLVEIKCVDEATVRIEYLRQLFSYFLLSELIADDGWPRARVEELCLYFARHACAYRIDAATLRAMPGFEELKRWMRKQACGVDAPQCNDQERVTAKQYTSRQFIVHKRARAFFGSPGEPDDVREKDLSRQLEAVQIVEEVVERKLRRSRRTAAPSGDFGLFLRWFDKGRLEAFRTQGKDAAPDAISTPLGRVSDLPV